MKNRHIILGAILSALAFLPAAQAVNPAPDGCYPNFTTAEGCNALKSLTTRASCIDFVGIRCFRIPRITSTLGFAPQTLALNNADNNTAVGTGALFFNTTGPPNTAVGADALVHNDDGSDNNAFGTFALFDNVNGTFNNAHGRNALAANTASENNAFGDLAMENNISGNSNTAIGDDALRITLTVVLMSLSVTRPAPVWSQASVTASRSARLVQVLLLPSITPASSAASSMGGERPRDPSTTVYVDQFNNVGVVNRRPGGSNTTFNRWTRPAKRSTGSSQ